MGGNTNGCTGMFLGLGIGISHEDGFDMFTVLEFNEEFGGGFVTGVLAADNLGCHQGPVLGILGNLEELWGHLWWEFKIGELFHLARGPLVV